MPQPTPAGTLVVGAGQAGVQLAGSLRQLGDRSPITLVGAEPHPPYQRPPLSKDFLTGSVAADSLAFRAPAWYVQQRIALVRGDRVVEVALPERGRPGTARTAGGRTLRFARLALTVGARPRRLDVPGAGLDGVHYLRDLDDAVRLRENLDAAARVVVVGGGFIGLEAAAAARALGKQVTVVEATDRLAPRAVAPVVSEFLRCAHERRGTTVLLGAEVVGFGGAGRVEAVRLADGRELAAHLVLVGVGVVPRTELAEAIGLECDDEIGGIVTDDAARTSHRAVVAAGDCTALPHPVTGEGRVRLESVPGAVAQAGTAAATLLGRAPGPRAVPWFWSNQGDLRLQIAGLSTGYDSVAVRGEPGGESLTALYYRDGALIAVDAVNAPADYLVVRKALATGRTLPADKAVDASTPLKNLLAG
ncbi:MAG TPA: FAD-dependent oxidoreductase [Pseudonocardia sp.]|jgi:3-phenylpropionate/trans-cinnamate dioxygenase ferredoxin reductase subunit|uniref:NAD(P)/FAD-dependent oxidoreductase n=1 Tax=Pseudonocardia sp. TaxID=60912 RepID=UPI002B4B5547|nr:FAD-dependent oxidoreductase [Pseudonocardia sp.]HLU59707.1 FAD-dependent oxidoreductase [Pseudonocardia sp.]